MNDDPGFRYLNLENTWPSFQCWGLVKRDDGALTLAQVPEMETAIGEPLAPVEALSGPAGIGVDAEGNLYIANPAEHLILRWDACSGEMATLPCFGGQGSLPGQLRSPRGVLVGPRGALYVADSGNHRVQVVDLATLQVRAIWGQLEPYAQPEPSDAPGRFNEPWDVAADEAGNLYVVDHGNGRVQKFDADGRVISAFSQTIQSGSTVPMQPAYIATTIIDGEERLVILDQDNREVLVHRTDGSFDAAATTRWQAILMEPPAEVDQPGWVQRPAGVIFSGDVLYLGDTQRGRVLAFDREGRFIGTVRGYKGAVSALSMDRRNRLLVHPGGGGAVTRLLPGRAYVETGTFLAGPFSVGSQSTRWHRLQALSDPPPAGAHVQLYTMTTCRDYALSADEHGKAVLAWPDPVTGATKKIEPPWSSPSSTGESVDVASVDVWRPAPRDALDILLLNAPAPHLWIAGMLEGEGMASLALRQMRLTYDHETWLKHLPAIYRRDEGGRVLLERALSLFESLLEDEQVLIDELPRLFDPWAAPDDKPPLSWLDWLAGWLAFQPDEAWDEGRRRQAVAEAFALHRRRGTVEGLQRLIAAYGGSSARIEEPFRFASLWSLGEKSRLGFDTMLASAEPQGAVVGTTATLDQSHLIDDADYAVPLFDEMAHRFCVQVYTADLAAPDALEKVRWVLEREKPAHTIYHLCLIEPRMRVGFQARVGIDAVVGGPPPKLILDEPRQLGLDTVLPGVPDTRPTGARIGEEARVGRRAILT